MIPPRIIRVAEIRNAVDRPRFTGHYILRKTAAGRNHSFAAPEVFQLMTAANETILKFGYPGTLIAEYPHWLVLLRPQQVTAGALVLAHRGGANAFSGLPAAAFAGLEHAIRDIEGNLKALVQYERINYLMLMMVDPHVHFHVIPRYAGNRTIAGMEVTDHGWPRTPDLTKFALPSAEDVAKIVEEMKFLWRLSA
jgi:diadenosine tetraphosphate (Ap4A) HIT family hydrolase